VSWLHGDHLGSASLATNSSGGIEWQARYKPFGETRWTSGTLTTNRKFNGMKEEGALGGIYDFNARYDSYIEYGGGGSGGGRMYDPLIGRFLSADPTIPDVANPQALNRYAYGFNSPLKYTDPDGHCPMPSAEVGGSGIIRFASFIPTPTAQGPGGAIFKGDDRGFISHSSLNHLPIGTLAIDGL
jgi:hypothetical protein